MDYNSLASMVQSHAENDASEFTGEINNFVDRAESRLTRELDSYITTLYATTTLTAADPFLTLPTSCLFVRNLNMQDGGLRSSLYLKTDEFINEYWPARTSTGTPKYYAKWGVNTVIIAPAPTSTNVVEISYVARPTVLSSAAVCNAFSAYCANALFYATMVEACLFMKNSQKAIEWDVLTQKEIGALNNEGRRNRRDDLRVPGSPAGGDNSVTGGV